jgi:flagellar biosynthesis GTPase FlhF
MSSVNNRKKNNTNKNNKGNGNLSSKLGLGSFSKDFPEVAKMGAKVQSNFMSVANNKYFMYIMLFLGISTLLGFLSVRNFNAVILFVVVAFAMRYFTKNMGIIMLVAVILSNIISVKSTIEGMANNESKDVESDSDSEDDDDEDKKAAASNKAPASKNTVASKKAASKVAASNKALQEILNGQKNTNQKKETESMAPIDYKMSKDVEVDEDDDDAIDVQSTQQAAYNNLNKLIGDGGFSKMTKDTEKLMSQQENLAKAMESIGPLVQNAEKMMQGLNLDKFTGMLDKLNGMMGTGGAALKGASS